MNDDTFNKLGAFLSEFTATFLLLFLGCMGCIKNEFFHNTHLQACLNFGLVIMMQVVIFHCVTGPHMNPALSMTAILYKRISVEMGIIYMIGQMIGGILGYAALTLVVPDNHINPPGVDYGLCVTVVHDHITLAQAVAIEFAVTTVLCLVCCGIWDPRNAKWGDSIAIKFGLAIASLALTGASFTGASMNPARSFGPALWHVDFRDHWIYWVGPMSGSVFAPLYYNAIFWRSATGSRNRDSIHE